MPLTAASYELALFNAERAGCCFKGLPEDGDYTKLNPADISVLLWTPLRQYSDYLQALHPLPWKKGGPKLPPLPPLPKALEGVWWATPFDATAPFCSAFWIGFWHRDEPCPFKEEDNRNGWNNGREASRSKAAEAYRRYVAKCREAFRLAGWPEAQIP